MEGTLNRRVLARAAAILVAVPAVLVAEFLLLFALHLAASALLGVGGGPSEPYVDPRRSRR